MRILVAGGYANSLLNFRGELLKGLIGAGLEVHATAPNAPEGVVRELEQMGVRFHSVDMARTGTSPAQDLKYLYNMARLMARIKPTIYLGYTIKPVVFGSIAAWLMRVPRRYSLITGLGYLFSSDTLKARLYRTLAKLLYRLSLNTNSAVICQNRDDLSYLKEKGLVSKTIRCEIVNGSGVNIHQYLPEPLPDDPAFIFVGRLVKEKGIYEFLEAAWHLGKRYPAASFYVAGGRDDNPSSLSPDEIAALKRDEHVAYLGDVSDIRHALAMASVLVLPSYREGLPRSVLEAMSMGRAIITTKAPGCRDTIENGKSGVLVEPRSVEQLIAAMERFIKEPPLAKRMGGEARRLAEDKYDVSRVNREMLTIMSVVTS